MTNMPPKFKVHLDCPLCRCIMKQHPAGYFTCPECLSMFSPYGGPDKADLIALKMAAHRAKPNPVARRSKASWPPTRTEREQILKQQFSGSEAAVAALREQAATENASFVSVAGLTVALKNVPRKVGNVWQVKVHKQGEEEGFTCFCGTFTRFNAYVYAHMNEQLTCECEQCYAKFAIKRGRVRVIKAPKMAGEK